MRSLIIADTIFSLRERSLISRLAVGLADEGVHVACAAPDTVVAESQIESLTRTYGYRISGLAITRRIRAGILRDALIEGDDPFGEPDVVHVFGGAAWSIARELAELCGAAMAVEVWRRGLVPRARTLHTAFPGRCAFLAPDHQVERALLKEGSDLNIRTAAWGVHVPGAAREIFKPNRAWSVMITGAGRDASAYADVLTAIAELSTEFPDLMIFIDNEAAVRADLWKLAKKLDLLPRVSLIDAMENRRDLVLRADIMILPDARGEHRTLILDAMACGMLVIAADDTHVDDLVNGQTARLVDRDAPDGWRTTLEQSLREPETSRELSESARAYIREHRRASAHVSAVLGAYESIAGDPSLAFNSSKT